MLELLVTLVMAVFPACQVEDDPYCTVTPQPGDTSITVNLSPADPGPEHWVLTW